MVSKLMVGDYIWAEQVSKGEFVIPIGGKVVSIEQSRIKIQDDDGNNVSVSTTQVLKNMHISSIECVDDMINLGDLQEYAILRNLHKRYRDKQIYTYTGSLLVAINPYELLPIYTNALMQQYKDKRLEEQPPHIFAIGDNSYNDMRNTKTNQCIVISGESGAGKTESTKLILQYLATISGQHSWIEQQILEANPILEAFGNAKTVRNDNSSRFGKYIDIGFNRSGVIEGARIEQYLLEKSRLVSQNDGERNYHVFYSMLAGLPKEEKKRLDLADANSYAYLKGGRTIGCAGRNEEKEFVEILAALKVLNFSDAEVANIFTLLAAILHLGNLNFKTGSASNTESSDVADASLNDKIAKLLGVSKADLSDALTRKTIYAHGDAIVSTLSKEQAADSRNAFVKGIYGKIFIMIVEKINLAISQKKTPYKKIGVLDIFGFENFTINSFEQLCINYANENLQQFFVQHIFKLEQEYYTKEGINWSNISFIDNQSVLDLIGMKPMNMMSLIDEESKFPKGTDFTLLTKLHGHHGSNPNYLKPKSDVTPAFGVNHFAGPVFYDVPGFLDKNRDSFSQDLKTLVTITTNTTLKDIFEQDIKQESTTKKMVTLSFQFKSSLDQLMKNLGSCHPYFVRCIKPNEEKKPQVFDRELCCRQLRYSGMMETAKIRQAGYPIRFTYKEFVDRFRHLGKAIPPSSKGDCKTSTRSICENVFKESPTYQLGHTKLFLKHNDLEHLEELRVQVLEKYILVLQRAIKGWIYRRRYRKLKEAAIVFQKHFRARGYRSKFLKIRNGYQRLQACIMSRQQTFSYNNIRKNITKLQAVCRGYVVRSKHPFGQIYTIVRQRKLDEIDLKKSGIKNYRVEAETVMQQRLADCNRNYIAKLKAKEEEDNIANKMIDDVFDFIKDAPSSPIDIAASKEFVENFDKPDVNARREYEEDLSEYNFRKFAATYFVKNTSHQHSNKRLKDSLLDLPTPDDVLAAQALWITIMRFMGDYPEPSFDKVIEDNELVMNKVRETLSRSFINRKEYKEILREEQKMMTMKKTDRKKLISMTLKRKNKLLEDVKLGLVEDSYAQESYTNWIERRRTTNIEKIHFITSHGILRPELRDEIYCQICKQLTNNHTKASFVRGWILISLCVGCFPPSEKFQNYLRAFLRNGPPKYGIYCEARLNRTFQNGCRSQPPGYLELQATKDKETIKLEVKILDGTVQQLEVDSATTSKEVCSQIASVINLKDAFGFSLFIALYDKVMSLGFGSDHIMDAISQCEQYSKEKGHSERSSPWKLFMRKEFFTPWHKLSDCETATSLIYCQIIHGMKAGEYRCTKENDIVSLIATQYYVENGNQLNPKVLHSRIGEYLPSYIVKGSENDLGKWEQKITGAFKDLKFVKQNSPIIKAKESIVKYAKVTWPMLFSVFFEVAPISSPDLPKKNLIVAVNWTGIYIIDESEQIITEFTFSDITFVTFEKRKELQTCVWQTARKEEYVLHCPDAKNLSELLQYILDGLKKRSIYCVATQDYKHPTNTEAFLEFRKGDLITLKNGLKGESIMSSSYGYGECNGKIGDFPVEHVYIIPTLNEPPQDILTAFKRDDLGKRQTNTTAMNTIQRTKLHTLSNYASEHFRSSRRVTVGKSSVLTAARRMSQEELWKFTNEPIYQPLHQKLLENVELSKQACNIFSAILKYMGDVPAPKEKYANEYTDEIFNNVSRDQMLVDEVYCQIMRQLTGNRLSLSEEKGWDLMYLITGLFVPSPTLLIELQKFLQTRMHPLAEPCLRRILRTQKIGSRKFAPYTLEVDSIQHRSLQIFHKIYFPDDTDEAFEVDSMTKSSDLCASIASRLELETTEGFSLFLAIADKVFSFPDEVFFYDFLSQIMDWIRTTKPNWGSAAPIQAQYQVFFMKKLWINSMPGKYPNADEIFHYHQELPKYLKGYHKCGKEDAIKIASYILRARFETTAEVQAAIQQNLKDMIPVDLYKASSNSDWKKNILYEYQHCGNMSVLDAKTAFLKIIYEWPTFGSAFFEVKQTSDPILPIIIIVAINRKGVNIIHQQTKDVLVTYEFSELCNWGSGNTYFHLTVGNIMKKTKLLFETSQGYKMDDLITSYTNYLKRNVIRTQDKRKIINQL